MSRRRRGWQRMGWLDGITDSLDMNLGKLRKMMRDRETWCATVHGVSKSWPGLGNWATITIVICSMMASTFRVVIQWFSNFFKLHDKKVHRKFLDLDGSYAEPILASGWLTAPQGPRLHNGQGCSRALTACHTRWYVSLGSKLRGAQPFPVINLVRKFVCVKLWIKLHFPLGFIISAMLKKRGIFYLLIRPCPQYRS